MTVNQPTQLSGSSSGLFDEYVPRREFASEIGVTEFTLIRWEKDGNGPPPTRFGRKVFYYKPSVKEWQRSREKKVQPA